MIDPPTAGYGATGIHDQFIVLERKIPELRFSGSEDGELEKAGPLGRMWRALPIVVRMFLWLGVATVLTLGPSCWAHTQGYLRLEDFPLTLYKPWAESNGWIELLRWSLMIYLLAVGGIATHYTSILTPQATAYVARRAKKFLPVQTISSLEVICMVWRYLSLCLYALFLWLLSLLLFPYPEELVAAGHQGGTLVWSELPLNFFTERLCLLLLVSTVLIAGEKTILKSIAREFNQPLYRDRIQKALYALWTVAVLRKAASIFAYSHISEHQANFERLWKAKDYPYATHDLMSIFVLEQFVKLGKKSGERKQTMAKRLFRFLLRPGNSELFIDDIRPFFTRSEAEKAFAVLDTVGAGDVSEAEFVKVIDDLYLERAELINVLLTNSDVIDRLDSFMLWFVAILVFFSLFPIVGYSPSEALVPLGVSITPTMVAGTLIFGETIKSIFASVIFLFATHPYDVGDRIYMDQGNFFVREIGLLSTMFERWDGFIVYIPNSVLATKAICNVRRTGYQSQRIEISLPGYLSASTLNELEVRLTTFIQNETRDFAAIRACRYEMRDLNQIVMIIALRHRANWQEAYPRALRNNKFMAFLTSTINLLGIRYYTTVRCVELVAPEELQQPSQ